MLIDVIADLSDYLLLCVGDVTFHDQQLLFNLTRRRKHKTFSEIWVIHNMMNYKEKMSFLNNMQKHAHCFGSELVNLGGDEKFYYSRQLGIRHLFLTNPEFGLEHNNMQINLLKKWVASIVVKKSSEKEKLLKDALISSIQDTQGVECYADNDKIFIRKGFSQFHTWIGDYAFRVFTPLVRSTSLILAHNTSYTRKLQDTCHVTRCVI